MSEMREQSSVLQSAQKHSKIPPRLTLAALSDPALVLFQACVQFYKHCAESAVSRRKVLQ